MRSISGIPILIAAAAISVSAAAGAATSTPPPIIPPHHARTAVPTRARPLDLNTASERELEALPGIRAAEARRIVDARPFASVSELSRADLPAATLEKITPLVAVTGAGGASTPMGAADKPMNPPLPGEAPGYVPPPHRGMVWADPDARTYRPASDPASGRTPHGRWMSESRAIREGYRKTS